MTDVVLDASIVLKWFSPGSTGERHVGQARRLRDRYQAGEITVCVPSLLFLEILNIAGRRWAWSEDSLLELASLLEDLRFDTDEPPLESIAEWTARGLSAYDAAYVALAKQRGVHIITDDERIIAVAPDIADALKNVE